MRAGKELSAVWLIVLLLCSVKPAVAEVSYSQQLSAGKNLISIGVETELSPRSLFGEDLVAIWQIDARTHSGPVPNRLIPGIGYWAVMGAASQVSITGAEVKSPHVVAVSKGRNLRGNPFHKPLAWKEVFLCYGGDCLAMEEACASNWVGGILTLAEGRWSSPDLTNGSLTAGAGFSLDVYVNDATLEFRQTQDWTIMLYLDGDDPAVQSDYLEAFADMVAKSVGSNAQVNIVAQFDRYPGDSSYGGWTIAHRFFVTPGMEPVETNAIMDWGDRCGGREVAMSEPETLADFIDWAASNYPARRYVLLIADHGYGWQGLVMDMTSLGDFMTVKELKSVLEKTPIHFELLALDACLMQMLEVVYELKDCAVDLVVASEAPGGTWPLADLLKVPLDHPEVSAEDFARSICDLYIDSHPTEADLTLSVFNLASAAKLTDSVKALAAAIYESDCADSSAYETVRSSANEVLAQISEAVLYFRNGADYADAHGITVSFPLNSVYGMSDVFVYQYQGETIDFATDALWRNFLFTYYNIMIYEESFNRCIDPRVFNSRNACTVFDEDHSKIDLYDFCRRLVEAP